MWPPFRLLTHYHDRCSCRYCNWSNACVRRRFWLPKVFDTLVWAVLGIHPSLTTLDGRSDRCQPHIRHTRPDLMELEYHIRPLPHKEVQITIWMLQIATNRTRHHSPSPHSQCTCLVARPQRSSHHHAHPETRRSTCSVQRYCRRHGDHLQ